MGIIDLITPQSIIPNLHATSKKQVLQALSLRAAEITQEHERTIFELLLARERLGTTGVGAGVAIPHGKLPGLGRIFGVCARLDSPVDFEAVDDQPVDLLFLLSAPESAGADHLKALARVSRLLRDKETCDKLRRSETAKALYFLLTETTASHAA